MITKSEHLIKFLRMFDSKKYRLPDDAPEVNKENGFDRKQELGEISDLITCMVLKDADVREISRAVKHSMVIIDAEKYHLDWQKSSIDNGIAELKAKYEENDI